MPTYLSQRLEYFNKQTYLVVLFVFIIVHFTICHIMALIIVYIIIITIIIFIFITIIIAGLVISMSDYWSWSRGFDPRHFPKFKMWIRSGAAFNQPCEDNWEMEK